MRPPCSSGACGPPGRAHRLGVVSLSMSRTETVMAEARPEVTYRPGATLARLATPLFVAAAVVAAVATLCTVMQIQVLESARYGGAITPAQAEAHDARQRLLAVVDFSVALAAFVLFLTWVYRANRNARALGADWMAY